MNIDGYLSVGPATVYGRNAMHWGVRIWTRRWGYVCFRLPLRCFGRWWPLYLYLSPNATPWAATFIVGGGRDFARDRKIAWLRRRNFGHGFNVDTHYEALRSINEWAPQ